jgi:hypothetical protein
MRPVPPTLLASIQPMPLYEAIKILEVEYSDLDAEAEKLQSEDYDLCETAKLHRRALAVALENLYQVLAEAT